MSWTVVGVFSVLGAITVMSIVLCVCFYFKNKNKKKQHAFGIKKSYFKVSDKYQEPIRGALKSDNTADSAVRRGLPSFTEMTCWYDDSTKIFFSEKYYSHHEFPFFRTESPNQKIRLMSPIPPKAITWRKVLAPLGTKAHRAILCRPMDQQLLQMNTRKGSLS